VERCLVRARLNSRLWLRLYSCHLALLHLLHFDCRPSYARLSLTNSVRGSWRLHPLQYLESIVVLPFFRKKARAGDETKSNLSEGARAAVAVSGSLNLVSSNTTLPLPLSSVNCFYSGSREIRISRGSEPLGGPTIPASSSRSMMRLASVYPILSLRWILLVLARFVSLMIASAAS